jgi:osmotically-inducible protein OsmY
MRRNRYASLLALIPALALHGCAALVGAGGVAAVSSLEDRRTTGTQLDDSAIESRAGLRIAERIGERGQINVTAFNRTVLLTGEAWDEQTRELAEKIVNELPTVRSVANEIQVGSLSSASSRVGDAAITAKVKSAFINVQGVSSSHVKVVTEAGVVYLLGIVTEAEADKAVEIARTTGGVRKVVKLFEYCKEGDEQCRLAAAPEKPRSQRM